VKDLALVGIRTGGVHLAHRLVKRIQDIEGLDRREVASSADPARGTPARV
jgi:pyrimidine operon attenuation protein/uracil phosphoribosyltransferase